MRALRGASLAIGAFLSVWASVVPASAQICQQTGSFEAWLDAFKQEAASKGVSQKTIAAALGGVTLDPSIIQKDRAQGVFSQTFLQFSDRMVNGYRLQKGTALLRQYTALFSRIEQQFGVPGPVLVALWGLETDFGANTGNIPTIRAIATLAYDCRRGEHFRAELIDALRIIERGDLTPAEMRGAWAGEIGQTQFMPSSYVKFAVDYEGDGKRDLIRSVPDVLASTANYLQSYGWHRNEPWLQEVRVPAGVEAEAGLDRQKPRSYWVEKGLTLADGNTLPSDELLASLHMPMARNGPAFLAYPNFQVFLQWNKSVVYSTTAAYMAARLNGAPAVARSQARN